MYIAQIETRVAGIPCLVGISAYERIQGSYDYNAASDWDYQGRTECDWDVCDRRGRKASWLERKLTTRDISRIQDEIAQHFENA